MLPAGHGIVWNGNFGMENTKIEWKISRMEWKTIFLTNSILDFARGNYRKVYTDMIINILAKVFNIYYSSANRGTSVVCITQTVYVLHHS